MLVITSPSFETNGMIPARHTCDGLDISPALDWAGVPAAAKSLVLIVDDPDAPDPAAPRGRWTHWLLYNLPVSASGLPEGVAAGRLPAKTRQGVNDWGSAGYDGPCPPVGVHRYFFRLMALDAMLSDLSYPHRTTLERTIQSHIIEQAELVGRYQRSP